MKTKKRLNKSEWIRSQPASVSAQDLVKLAKKEGFTLTAAQIYTTRSQAKKKDAAPKSAASKSAAPVAAKKLGRPRKVNGAHGPSNGQQDIKRDFIRLAVRIGTDQAKQMLDQFVASQ
jgi:hypothetical protein